MQILELPAELEPFREKLESTIQPFIRLKSELVATCSPWASKIAGFPYLPKGLEYPKDEEGKFMFLLAQINFDEMPPLEDYPHQGILQFYIKLEESGYGLRETGQTKQSTFKLRYFSEIKSSEKIITDFSFLPNFWMLGNAYIPFYALPHYSPKQHECFSIKPELASAPISDSDHQFETAIGKEVWDILASGGTYELWEVYRHRFVHGHRIGGYPKFTQTDFRKELNLQNEDYCLLLQIDSVADLGERIHIEWGDVGVCNFWIKRSDLRQRDFSKVIYHWDCS